MARADLGLRWRIDEAECRLQGDLDGQASLAVAQRGLALAGSAPPPAALRPAWWRLRACLASSRIQAGEVEPGRAELARLVGEAPAGSEAWAMARLERGVDLTRVGQFEAAQDDLLAACETLQRQAHRRDTDLCLAQLANHYRRTGDLQESLRLLRPLYDEAQRQGEAYDASIYAYAMASTRLQLRHPEEALALAREAAEVSQRLGDRLGTGYAWRLMAAALTEMGRLDEALQRVDASLTQIDRAADEREHDQATVLRAQLLARLGRPGEALVQLDRVGASVQRRNELPLVIAYWSARALTLGRLESWRAAFDAANQARDAEQQLARQRLSEQAARLGKQFHRERDAQELATLRDFEVQGERLRQTQALALVLLLLLLAGGALLGWRKWRLARQLRVLADTDELTGLANRRAWLGRFDEVLALAASAERATAVLMIDIDHFKQVNDRHGHAVGDALLRHVAQVLGGALRDGDLLGRWGGEEFLALLPGSGRDEALAVAERMRQAVLARPLPTEEAGDGLPVQVSIGVASALGGAASRGMIEQADAALYRAKSAGRNRVAT